MARAYLAERLASARIGIDYLGVDDWLVALCESIALLSRCARSRRFFIRRCVPSVMRPFRAAITFARIVSIRPPALSRLFVQNVPSHFPVPSMVHLPARTARIERWDLMQPCPLIAAAGSFVLSFCNSNTIASYSCGIPSRNG